jgi:GTP-binding protein EngB required for normal cell division
LADRVAALDRFVALTRPYLPSSTLDPAQAVLDRAGGRLSLSRSHTVVALAGATGSGKSSVFNALAGAELSPVGLRRPTTGRTHAAVFGAMDGTDEDAHALLDWLGVDLRLAGRSTPTLPGLVLLDLPDIDSVERAHFVEADRLLELVDLIVWVLDPQKYADLTVHRRFRETFQHHADVTVVAFNQADRLSPSDLRRCLDDLRTILQTEGLGAATVLSTSAVTPGGLDELRSVLEKAVAARMAALQRLSADLDSTVDQLLPAMAGAPGDLDRAGPSLSEALAVAAGVPVVVRATRQSYVYRATRHTGWPVTRWTSRLRGDPLRLLGLGGRTGSGSPSPADAPVAATGVAPASPAAQARVGLAVRSLADSVAGSLVAPWPSVVLDAARSRAGDVPDALDVAVATTDLRAGHTPMWWRVLGFAQLMLLVAAVAGLAWLAVRWVFFALALPQPPMPTAGRLPWPTLLLVGGVLGGLLLAMAARAVVNAAARRHAARTHQRLTRSVAQVGEDLIGTPVAQVRDDYLAARTALRDAANG